MANLEEPQPTKVTLERREGYEFIVRVEGTSVPEFFAEEGPPLGEARGPSPDAMLGAAVGSCLASSLLFCVGKTHATVDGLRANVSIHKVRNERGRLRIGAIEVELHADIPEEQHERFERCRALFEDYCTVTASVRQGIAVEVKLTTS